jgi:hypothetical protein
VDIEGPPGYTRPRTVVASRDVEVDRGLTLQEGSEEIAGKVVVLVIEDVVVEVVEGVKDVVVVLVVVAETVDGDVG